MTEYGKVLWFCSKGYGFILRDGLRLDDPNSQIYVHVSAINSTTGRYLRPKQRVQFDFGPGRKKGTLEAIKVSILL